MSGRGPTESGVVVYPKLPIPQRHNSEPRPTKPRGGVSGKLVLMIVVVVALAAAGLGVAYGPEVRRVAGIPETPAPPASAPPPVVADREASASATARADALDKQLIAMTAAKAKAETALEEAKHAAPVPDKTVDSVSPARLSDAVMAKLKAAIDRGSGTVTQEADEVHLRLVDKVLFKPADDQLTDRGRHVLDRLAAPLAELADRYIDVQGHTDDQPIANPPPPKKPVKGAPASPAPRFATSWELSSARALAVVRYLQDVAKIDPSRLAALAFGQYRPLSKTNKAANRRIEIVLVAKRAAGK